LAALLLGHAVKYAKNSSQVLMLMLMTQMGVRTLLDSHFHGNAIEFLNLLEKV
jgi:hypothetical protein